MESLVKGRIQFTSDKRKGNAKKEVKRGVPQGAIL